jgi:hypothetical protein
MNRAFLVLALTLVSSWAVPAGAQSLYTCAADTHVARRGAYMNGTTSTVDQGVWEWEIGSGFTYSNIQGISADGLLHATAATGDPAYALAAFPTANLLIGRYNANPMRTYAQDADFLWDVCKFDPQAYGVSPAAARALLSPAVANNQGYCTMATIFYSRLPGQFPNPNDNVDRHIAPRGSLAGWDLGWHVRAAWRTGFESYATAMLARILERRPDWEHVLLGGYDYTEESYGALTRVIFEMHAAGAVDDAVYNEGVALAGSLLASQGLDGSWGGASFQTTAYVLLGLRADPTHLTAWHAAINKGEHFLNETATASPTCGWSYPPEYAEDNSEILMALSLVDTLPFSDGFESAGIGSSWSWSEPVSAKVSTGPIASRPPALPVL